MMFTENLKDFFMHKLDTKSSVAGAIFGSFLKRSRERSTRPLWGGLSASLCLFIWAAARLHTRKEFPQDLSPSHEVYCFTLEKS